MTFLIYLGITLFLAPATSWGDDRLVGDEPALDAANPPIRIKSSRVRFTVEPKLGGRIVSLRFMGHELLCQDRDNDGYHLGSTLWNSPQSEWKWPPVATFDSAAYTVIGQSLRHIEMKSQIDPETQLQLFKTFRIQEDTGDINLTYRWLNHGDIEQRVSAWEVSRVDHEGYVCIHPNTRVRMANANRPPRITKAENLLQIELNAATPHNQKLFVNFPDGFRYGRADRPRLLYTTAEGTRWVKTLMTYDCDEVAPGESPVEIYFGTNKGFTELEVQGPYRSLARGESFDTHVRWSFAAVNPPK